ncbi:hypothetical protein EV182_000093 [Spiromyces aspiralis]|uniref:Uncharacterized protein n=1 Tax=Spiromyces aspiralis TaxID=68401 RepID=A0ACC1HNX6_9FUNG|nr:hypothetical protein EV182_000093 [Spiromyces aspiralis]
MPINQIHDANFPVDSEGRTYHVEVRRGDVANRIVTVGDPARAKLLAESLDAILFEHMSHRGFLTITGLYCGLPVSIVAIGMGFANMDFFIREVRAVVDGPMAVIRLGSCGSLSPLPNPSDIIVADRTYAITRNFGFFDAPPALDAPGGGGEIQPYLVSSTVDADAKLTRHLIDNLLKWVPKDKVYVGTAGSADTFYASQGRKDPNFNDHNQDLITQITKGQPERIAFEMEAHMLYHLARCSQIFSSSQDKVIRASCALMVYINRAGNATITPQQSKHSLEVCTKAIFDALVDDMPTQKGSVWDKVLD